MRDIIIWVFIVLVFFTFNKSIQELENKIQVVQNELNKTTKHLITLTAYSPTRQETDSTPYTTASMTRPVQGKTIAVSRDLFNKGFTFGRKVYIKDYGVFVIEDLMNSRFKKRIDIFFWNTKIAKNFGKRENKQVYLILGDS